MKILVTGANGQVGHELLRAMLESPPLQGRGGARANRGFARRRAPGAGAEGRAAGENGMFEPAAGLGGDGVDVGVTPKPIPTPALPLKGRENSRASREIIPATRDGALEGAASFDQSGIAPCQPIDLADSGNLTQALDRIAPDLIINAAAYTAVDRAEDEPEQAMRVNADAVGVLGAWAARHHVRVVHYSTDYVFDGSARQPYREDDPTQPLGVYGRSKLAGERALRESGARHLILRTAWVYGARGRNFLRTMLKLGGERDELRVVDDQIGAPTSAGLIAGVTARVVARWFDPENKSDGRTLDGTYHLVAAGQTSWCGFARAIFERVAMLDSLGTQGSRDVGREAVSPRASRAPASLRPSQAKGKSVHPLSQEGGRVQRGGMQVEAPRVTAIATADYPTRAARPAYSVLDTSKLRATFGVELPEWQTVLDRVIAELRSA